jgi:hypothetical protein
MCRAAQQQTRKKQGNNCAGWEKGRTERAMAERSMVSLSECVSGTRFLEGCNVAKSSFAFDSKYQGYVDA